MANTTINLVNLDVDTLKESFKTYLKGQSVFKDYDFEGSNINVLLDLLAYNTFHNAFYLNMVASEAFLDSAQLRESVISHAKELNYVPRSVRSAKANINMTFTANTNVITIPKGTSFTASIGNELFTFLTDEATVHFSSDTATQKRFNITSLDIYEGQVVIDSFIMNYSDPTQRLILTDPNIDTRSISVNVIEDNETAIYPYTQASSLLGLDYQSKVYFLQAAEKGRYEILFGDNVIGKKPKDGALIEVTYRRSRGSAGNGAIKFYLDTDFSGGKFGTIPVVNTNDIAEGGAEAESLDSIKYYAPRHFQIQERAINTSDYEIMLKQRFPEINTVSAYGGEDLVPPQYGKVYISVDISDVDGVPQAKIQEYTNFLKPRSPLSIDPVFVEPDYVYFSPKTTVKYNVNVTTLTSEQIKTRVINKILNYNLTNLNDFKSVFYYSKFIRDIDDACSLSIVSNETDVKIYKKFEPQLRKLQNFKFSYNIPLSKNFAKLGTTYDANDTTTISSSEFILNGERVFLHDDGNGVLRVVKYVIDEYIAIVPNVGKVNYDTGTVELKNFKIDSYLGNSFKIYAVTANKDFASDKNVILTLEANEIKVDVIPIRDITGASTLACQRA